MRRSILLAACMTAALAGLSSARAAAPTTEQFIADAATSDMFEIQSSQLASERADGAIKTFAAQMIADHQKTTDELQKMLGSNAVAGTVPTAMSDAQQAMLDKLKTLNGADFAKQYAVDQIQAHRSAIAAFKAYAADGDHAGMKEWAIKTLPDLQHHLEMAEGLGA